MKLIRFGTEIGDAKPLPSPFGPNPIFTRPPPLPPPPAPRAPHRTDKLPRNLVTDVIVDQWNKHKREQQESPRLKAISEANAAKAAAERRRAEEIAQAKRDQEAWEKGLPRPRAPYPGFSPLNKLPTLATTPQPMVAPPPPKLAQANAGNIVATGILAAVDKIKEAREQAENEAIRKRLMAKAAEQRRATEARQMLAKKAEAEAAKKAALAKAEAAKKAPVATIATKPASVSGTLLRFGTDEERQRIRPAIAMTAVSGMLLGLALI